MYRNLNKSKLLLALSTTDNTFDTNKQTKIKLNTSNQTINKKAQQRSFEESKDESQISLPILTGREKEKTSSNNQFKLKFSKHNNNDLIQKKIIKGKLMKLINNSSLEPHFEEEVKFFVVKL